MIAPTSPARIFAICAARFTFAPKWGAAATCACKHPWQRALWRRRFQCQWLSQQRRTLAPLIASAMIDMMIQASFTLCLWALLFFQVRALVRYGMRQAPHKRLRELKAINKLCSGPVRPISIQIGKRPAWEGIRACVWRWISECTMHPCDALGPKKREAGGAGSIMPVQWQGAQWCVQHVLCRWWRPGQDAGTMPPCQAAG